LQRQRPQQRQLHAQTRRENAHVIGMARMLVNQVAEVVVPAFADALASAESRRDDFPGRL